MTIGSVLRSWITALQPSDAVLAATELLQSAWQEQLVKGAAQFRVEPAAVAEHLSKILDDQPEGIEFFFGEHTDRASLLLIALKVPEIERPAVRACARATLKNEPLREILIDLEGLQNGGDSLSAIFAEIERWSSEYASRTMTLLLSPAQLDVLPRRFDRLDNLTTISAAPSEVVALIHDHVGPQSLLVSGRQLAPVYRWAALSHKHSGLVTHPDKAIAIWNRQERLPEPPSVPPEFVLDSTPDSGLLGMSLVSTPSDPVARRTLMFDLVIPRRAAKLGRSASERAALARALGVQACATPSERGEIALKKLEQTLGLRADEGSHEDLKREFSCAARRARPARLFRIKERLHLVSNQPVSAAIKNHPQVTVHEMRIRQPSLTRLRQHIATWTQDDIDDDPYLQATIEKLDPRSKERNDLRFAQECILHSAALTPAQLKPVPDAWQEALAVLTTKPPPPAELVVEVDTRRRSWSSGLPAQPMAFIMPDALQPLLVRGEANAEPLPPPAPPLGKRLTINRSTKPLKISVKSLGAHELGAGSWWFRGQHLLRADDALLVHDRNSLDDINLWHDLLEASPAFGGRARHENRQLPFAERIDHGGPKGHRRYVIPRGATQRRLGVLKLAPELWAEADQRIGLLWFALRRALRQAEFITVPSRSSVLLHLGGRNFAELHPRRHARDDQAVKAAQFFHIKHEKLVWCPGTLQPDLFRLDGGGWRVDVNLVESDFM